MDGKLPPWNIHGSHSNSVPYTSRECQENRDFIGESMPSLSSCMSGAFRALLPDYHGTSLAMTTNKYSYSPDDHCVLRSGAGMSYIENTMERREKLDFIKDPPDEASVTHMLPSKCTQYEKGQELDHRNSHNWTSVIKDALEMSNGMEMGQSISANVCGSLVDLNPVYKEPQYKELKPNKKQDGRVVGMLSDGISKQQDAQEMRINPRTYISREELGMTVVRGHEPGYYSSHTRHSLEGYTKYDEFSRISFFKQHEEPTLQQSSEHGLSRSLRNTLETSTKTCFKDAKMHVTDNSALCGLKADGHTSVNPQPYPSNYNDQKEMVYQSNLHVSDTTLTNRFVSKLENKVSTSPREQGMESSLSLPEQTKTKGWVNTKNTELSLKVEAKFAPEMVSFSNQNLSSVSENVSQESALSNKMHIDDKCKGSIQEQSEKGCFQETLSSEAIDVKTDVCDLHVQEKQSPAGQDTVLTPFRKNTHNSKMCEQTFFNNAKESSNHSTQHNLQNALPMYKKPRKRKKSELEKLNSWIDKSTKVSDCSLNELEILDGAVKPDSSGVGENSPVIDRDMITLEKDSFLKYDDVSPPSKSRRKTPKKSKREDFVAQGYVPESPCVSVEQPDVVGDTAENSEAFHVVDTPDSGNIGQMDNRNKPSQPVRKSVHGRKRKISKLRLKAKSSAVSHQSLSQSNASPPEEDFASHSQVISSLQSSNTEYKPAISQSNEDSPQTSKVCQTASQQEYTPSSLDHMGFNVKKVQKARRPVIKALMDKKDATGLLDGESVSQTNSVSTCVNSSIIQSPQNNQRKPRQKKRADVSEASETLKESPPVGAQQEDVTSPLSKCKENVATTKTRPVKGKRASRKNVKKSDDHKSSFSDEQTFTATLKQEGEVLRTQKAFPKKVSKSGTYLMDSCPEKTMKARRYSKNNTSNNKTGETGYLDEETSLLHVSQENSASPLKIDSPSSYRLKKSRKKTDTKIKDEQEQTLNHTEYQHEKLSTIPDPIIASSDAQMTLKYKKPAKKTRRHQEKNEHANMQTTDTLKQEDCPTSFVFNTPKKYKKISDVKGDAIHAPADDQTMPQPDISSVNQKSEATNVPLKKRRFRTQQTLNTVSENYEHVHSIDIFSPDIGNPVDSTTETDYLDVFSQQNIVKTKRSTKKVTRRKKNLVQAINFGELASPATLQEENSALTSEKYKNPTSDLYAVNGIADYEERRIFVSTENAANIQSSPKKPKKNWLKQIEKNEQELHNSTTETANNLKTVQDSKSDLPSVLTESVSENFEQPNTCEQKWRAAKRKSKRSRKVAETYGFCVSLSEEALSPTKIKTELGETDVMVTDVQDFSNGSEVDQKDSLLKHEPTIKRPKVLKAPKKKKRKAAKKKKIPSLLPYEIEKEEEVDTSDNRVACDVQTQVSDHLGRTAVTPEEPVKLNMYISRKSTRIGIINSDVKTASDQVNSTATLDITESTRLEETRRSEDCKVPGILMKKKRGRPRKHKLPAADLKDSIQILDISSCQDSTVNTIQTASNMKLNVVQHHNKKKGKKTKKKLTVNQLEIDPSPQSITDLGNNTSSQSICRREHKKNFKAPDRKVKLPCLRVSSRISEQGKAEISSLPQKPTKVLKKVAVKASIRGKGIIRKLNDRTTIPKEIVSSDVKIEKMKHGNIMEISSLPQKPTKVLKKVAVKASIRGKGIIRKLNDRTTIPEEIVSSDVKITKIKHGKQGRRGQPRKKPRFEDLQTQIEPTQLTDDICDLLFSNVKDEEPEQILLDTKMKAYTHLRLEKEPDNSPEIASTFQEQKVDGFTQYSEKHVAMPHKKIVSKVKEKVKKPLACKYCAVSFRHITAYVMHQRIHTGVKPYKCKSCSKTFAQLSKLKSHQKVHKKSNAFPCPCCNQTFLKREDLLNHFKAHLQELQVNTKPEQSIKNKTASSSVVSSKKLSICHVCKICKKNFVSKAKLETHMQVHEADKPWTCKDCGKKFCKSSSLTVHEKSHWPVKPYACSICGKGFDLLKALKKHSQEHTGKTPFSCSHCAHAFSALSALRMHQASKLCVAKRNDEENCDVEGFIVSQGVEGQVNTPVFFKCQICKQLFKKWCQYTLHLQTHTSLSPYLCFSCGQCYEKDSEINVHCELCCQSSGEAKTCGGSVSEIMQSFSQTNSDLRSKKSFDSLQSTGAADLSGFLGKDAHHSPIKRPISQSPTRSEDLECIEISPSLWKFQCSRCGLRFERYRMLCAHMHTHAPAFRYTCAHCGQSFERWSKLWMHQRRHRAKGRCYSCTQCSLQFRFFSSYKEHMFEHAGQRPYACPLCSQTFIQEESLHAHQYESHQLRESLKCDVCSKTFSALRNLVKHSLLHNGSTSHVCLLCGLSFTNTRALQQHLNTHAGYHGLPLPDVPSKPLSYPHQCKRCKACFSTGDLLYAHQICHSRNAKTKVRPEVQSTSKASHSRHTDKQSLSQTTPISNLSDKSLYVYSHPDQLYLTPSLYRERHRVIPLDSNVHVSDSQNTSPEMNSNPSSSSEGPVVACQPDSTHLPQDTSGQENTNSESSESIQKTNKTSHKHQRSVFVETSINMDVETVHEESEESFECADCTEKLTSVLGLYEHYILHALGDTCVQVH